MRIALAELLLSVGCARGLKSLGFRDSRVKGLALLAQTPLARPLPAALLPGLRCLLWDASAAVRTALADLLLSVGCARSMYSEKPGRAPREHKRSWCTCMLD